MPKVGGKTYAYTPKGKAQAAKARKAAGGKPPKRLTKKKSWSSRP